MDAPSLDARGATGLLALRPVTFRYKKESADGEKPIQFGLIAEEVAEVFPELVAFDQEGQPETVLYSLLTPRLLNELQKQQAELVELRAAMAGLPELQARLARLEASEAVRDRPLVVARR